MAFVLMFMIHKRSLKRKLKKKKTQKKTVAIKSQFLPSPQSERECKCTKQSMHHMKVIGKTNLTICENLFILSYFSNYKVF